MVWELGPEQSTLYTSPGLSTGHLCSPVSPVLGYGEGPGICSAPLPNRSHMLRLSGQQPHCT